MPPVLGILAGLASAATIGTDIAGATKKAPAAAPVTSLPGSPLDVILGTGGTPATSKPSGGNVFDQIITNVGDAVRGVNPNAPVPASATSAATGGSGVATGTGGKGGGATSAAPPASIGGGSDFNTLPWFQSGNGGAIAPQPGTPAAI